MTNTHRKLAHSVAEFAHLVGLGRSYIYEEIKKGNLRVRKAGRRTIILEDEGQDWLSQLPVLNPRSSSEPV